MMADQYYSRYIYHLAELHKDSGNWAEAGFTLLLHAQLLQVLLCVCACACDNTIADCCRHVLWYLL